MSCFKEKLNLSASKRNNTDINIAVQSNNI